MNLQQISIVDLSKNWKDLNLINNFMRFKEFCLTEASKEYNISKVVADKIVRLLRDMVYSYEQHPERYVKNKQWTGAYKIPLSQFLKDIDIPKYGILDTIKNGHLFLDRGHFNLFDKNPWLNAYSKNGLVKASGYFSPSREEYGIHIPFIDAETGKPFGGFFDFYHSLIIHELTHFIQDSKERLKTGTSDLSTDEWFKNDKEKEAYFNELYRDFQKYVSELIREMKSFRSKEYKSPEYFKYVNRSNLLKRMFSSFESFKKQIIIDVSKIFLDNPKAKDGYLTLQDSHPDIFKEFLETTYEELKKEFKASIPEKDLVYTKEDFRAFLTEASKEYNYVNFFVDKIVKTLKEFSKNRSRYWEYQTEDGWSIPISKIVSNEKFPKDGILHKLTKGTLNLCYGEINKQNKTPEIRYNIKQKDGSYKEYVSKGLYSPAKNSISIPFIDEMSDKTYEDKLDYISSTLLHEFTHMLQNVSGVEMKKTAGLGLSGWFKDENEREALSNQIYKEFQKMVFRVLEVMKISKNEYLKTKDKDYYKEYLKIWNDLYVAFEDVDAFEKFFNKNLWIIKYTNKSLFDKIEYYKEIFKDEFDDFILKMFIELKKEFKNMIPEKEINL